MQKTDFALKFTRVEDQINGLPVIIVAAGSASRMQGLDKIFAQIGGLPVIVRTLRAFENCSAISEITVVTREEKIADIKKLAERYSVSKLKNIVTGGTCREESVKNGILLYKDKSDKVLVHDAARPLVTDSVIKGVVKALESFDSVTCAVNAKDTIKTVDGQGMAADTLDRAKLVCVQTPQGVNVQKFLTVCETEDLTNFTDDTSVMEFLGLPTKITGGDYNNIKITTPEDIAVAEAILGKDW